MPTGQKAWHMRLPFPYPLFRHSGHHAEQKVDGLSQTAPSPHHSTCADGCINGPQCLGLCPGIEGNLGLAHTDTGCVHGVSGHCHRGHRCILMRVPEVSQLAGKLHRRLKRKPPAS